MNETIDKTELEFDDEGDLICTTYIEVGVIVKNNRLSKRLMIDLKELNYDMLILDIKYIITQLKQEGMTKFQNIEEE